MSQAIQSDFSVDMVKGLAGDVANNGSRRILSKVAAHSISFGKVVALQSANNADGVLVKRPQAGLVTLTASANYVTGNTISGTVTATELDGTATPTVISVPFNTDQATTASDLASAIQAAAGVDTATVNGGDNKIIDIVADADTDLNFGSFVVTGGASQATITFTYNTSDIIIGISSSMQKEENTDGSVKYNANDSVNVLTQGAVFVSSPDAVDVTKTVYFNIREGADEAGTIKSTATNAVALSQSLFRSSATANNISVVELNRP